MRSPFRKKYVGILHCERELCAKSTKGVYPLDGEQGSDYFCDLSLHRGWNVVCQRKIEDDPLFHS